MIAIFIMILDIVMYICHLSFSKQVELTKHCSHNEQQKTNLPKSTYPICNTCIYLLVSFLFVYVFNNLIIMVSAFDTKGSPRLCQTFDTNGSPGIRDCVRLQYFMARESVGLLNFQSKSRNLQTSICFLPATPCVQAKRQVHILSKFGRLV